MLKIPASSGFRGTKLNGLSYAAWIAGDSSHAIAGLPRDKQVTDPSKSIQDHTPSVWNESISGCYLIGQNKRNKETKLKWLCQALWNSGLKLPALFQIPENLKKPSVWCRNNTIASLFRSSLDVFHSGKRRVTQTPPAPGLCPTRQLRTNTTLKTMQPCYVSHLFPALLFLFCRNSSLFDMHEVISRLGSLMLDAW